MTAPRSRAVRTPKPLHGNEHAIFFALLRREGVPLPVPEFRFAPPRRWRFDFAWPDELDSHGDYLANMNGPSVALEIEGGVWTRGRHTRGAGFLNDMEKYNEGAIRGWRILRVTPSQLYDARTLDWIRRALHLSPVPTTGG